MGIHLRFVLLTLSLLWISGSGELLGISPEDESYYKSNTIKCKDGSKKFTKEQLNDNFCDCPDGTDEPGTSACPEGRFYCRNVGHFPIKIFSSRVNDGICDCCDGSDEYDGKVHCTNTCWEAGKAAREKLKKKIATYQDGITIRKQEVEKSKEAFAKDEAELSKLKGEEEVLKGLVKKLKDHKDQIDKAQEEERLKKEKEETEQKEAEMKANEQEKPAEVSPHDDTEGSHDKSESAHEVIVDASEENHGTAFDAEIDHNLESKASSDSAGGEHEEEDHDESLLEPDTDEDTTSAETSPKHTLEQEHGSHETEGLSKAELGRLVASRWTGENTAPSTNEADSTTKEEEHTVDSIPDFAQTDDSEGYASDEDAHKYDDETFDDDSDDEFEDHSESFPDADESTDFSDADNVRKEYDESNSKLSKIQSRISTLTAKLKHDFGIKSSYNGLKRKLLLWNTRIYAIVTLSLQKGP